MFGRLCFACAWLLPFVFVAQGGAVVAEVVVLANRSGEPVRFRLSRPDAGATAPSTAWAKIETGDIATAPVAPGEVLEFPVGEELRQYELEGDRCYFFYKNGAQGLELEAIGLAGDSAEKDQAGEGARKAAQVRAAPVRPAAAAAAEAKLPTIRIKLLVDDEERAAHARWEARLRARLAAASELFERCCRVKFEAIAIGTWVSDNSVTDFEKSLEEFERVVPADGARIAIGFTSQYQLPEGRTNLGGTRGPLQSHVLIREWSQLVSESERLELLIHELGHFLGAAHSPEFGSVMRPVLGDRQARARDFRITFDPLNALAICLVARELQQHPANSLASMRANTRSRLHAIYATLGQALPDDPAPKQYLSLLDASTELRGRLLEEKLPQTRRPAGDPAPEVAGPSTPAEESRHGISPLASEWATQSLQHATRAVLERIVAEARLNHARPLGRQAAGEELFRRSGDELTEAYVEAAAGAAAGAAEKLPEMQRREAFCLGLAIGLDTSDQLRTYPIVGDFIRTIEPEGERAARLKVLGLPTMRERHDLAQHFWISAAIAAIAGPSPAEMAGIAKEGRDADGGSGFSFCDLCADLAGISLAERLKTGDASMARIRRQFLVGEFLPPLDGLDEGLGREEFARRFGATSDPRFQAVKQQLRARIEALQTLE